MSKRKRPLSNYDWDLLGGGSDNNTRPTKRSNIGDQFRLSGEDEGDEEEEEETMHIDEDGPRQPQQQTQQQQGMAVLNSMPVKGKGKASIDDDVPCVCLDAHYSNNYNTWVNARFPRLEEDSDSEEEDEREEMDPLLGTMVRRKTPRSAYDTRERGECFLCAWGNRFHDGVKAKHVNILFGILDNFGSCANEELAMQLHLYFKEHVYREEKRMSMLTVEIALEHIVGMHSLSAMMFIGESIRTWKQALFCFKDSIFKANGKFDKEAFNNFKECQKMLCILYKMDIKTLNFNYGKSREDINKLGVPFFMMTEMKQVREKDKRTEKTKKLLATDVRYNRGVEI